MLKAQIAYRKRFDGSDGLNFLRLGRHIWPFKRLVIDAPVKLPPVVRDADGSVPINMVDAWFDGVEIDAGTIKIIDEHDRECVFSYIPPAQETEESVRSVMIMSREGFDDDMFTSSPHPFPGMEKQHVLVKTTFTDDGMQEQTVIVDPEASMDPVSGASEYIRRFGRNA